MQEMLIEAEGKYVYSLLIGHLDTEGFCCESYGVKARCPDTGEEARVEDVTVSITRIEELCEKLIRLQVSPLHLRDVVEDWL